MRVSTSIDVERPAAEVFDFVSDVPNNPSWQRGQQSARWTSDPPLRVGSTYDQHARFLGRDVVNSFRVVDYEPGRRVRFTSTAGSFPLTITRTVVERPNGSSSFTEEVDGDPRGFFRIAEPLLRPLVARKIRGDFARLKTLLEGR